MLLHLKVKPNSKIDQITVDEKGQINVKIRAQPIDGKANEYLIEFLAKIFKVSKSQVDILKGSTSKFKKVEISGDDTFFQEIINSFKS